MTEQQAFALLARRAGARGPARAAIDARLRSCEREGAILVTDYRNFSLFTELFGILHFLTLIADGERLLSPMVRRKGGHVLKWEADSLFAWFDGREGARTAIETAVALNRALAKRNSGRPEAEQLRLCCGIGFGKVFRFGREAFGHQVNRAAKLGEDLAGEEQILVTEDAVAAAGPGLAWHARKVARFKAFKFAYRELKWTV
ncbi:MAG: adenylate/guanylate cyclase domain-containing protein [Planctomycetia bacterium]|nr:adenylate/guanylate cyclase domain-containing protein [Planctomycetia bacterium]